METKAQNARWRKLCDKWEETALVAGIRSARAYQAGPNEIYAHVESIYFNGWSDRILGVLPVHNPSTLYTAGYSDGDAYFQQNRPPQPVAAKPAISTRSA